jgi:hypothetical protein
VSTIVLAAPRLPTNKATKDETPVELKTSKRLIFGTENGLSISDCGELGNTTQRKHFSWDVKIKIGNRTCNGVFISHQTILTSI